MKDKTTRSICLNKYEKHHHSDMGIVEFVFYLCSMYMNIDPVLYGARSTAIRAKASAFNILRKLLADERGSRGEKTGELYDFLDNMLMVIHEQYNWAVYTFGGKKSHKLKEVFHGGLELYYSLSRDNIILELDYLITKGEKYSNELGVEFGTAFTALKTQYATLYDDQTEIISTITTKIVEKNKARLELTKMLTSQYLLFCSEHVDDEAYVLTFFKFSIFTKHHKYTKSYVEYKATVEPLQVLNVAKEIQPKQKVVLMNKSSVVLNFGGGTDEMSPLVNFITVGANLTVEVLFDAISAPGDTFLNVFNTSDEFSANYIVNVYH